MICKEADEFCKIINQGKYYISEFEWKREYSFEDEFDFYCEKIEYWYQEPQ